MYYIGTDRDNKKIIIDENNYQVMMEWEKTYMNKLVEKLNPVGDVLEIGWGLGYSASKILQYNIESYTVIECSDQIIKNIEEWSKSKKIKINIVKGLWQKELKTLGKFDSIFFDDSPKLEYIDLHGTRVYSFFYSMLKSHVNRGARMTWFCDLPIHWICHPYTNYECSYFKTTPPQHCRYATRSADQSSTLALPLVSFPYGTIGDINPIVFDESFKIKRLEF